MTDEPIFTIEVDVYDVSDVMLMARAVGEGSYKGEPTELIVALPAMSPVVRFRDKDYMVKVPEIAETICKRIADGKPE
jgi:hypothetical protein